MIFRAAYLLLTTFLFATPLGAMAQQPIVINFSHVAAADTPKGEGALRFKQLAEERTKGRVQVNVYPNSALFKDKEELEALQMGSVQMLAPSVSKFTPMGIKEFEVFDLPYVTPDIESFHRVADSDFGKGLLKKLEPRGIKGLAYWDAGFRVITANRPIRKLADYKGLRIRINSSKVIEAQIRSLGAIPQTMAFSEVYLGLQTGVVDGSETVLTNVYTQKFYEVQKHISLTHHTHQAYAIVTNKKFWEGLPPEIRTTLEGAVRDATTFVNARVAVDEAESYEKIVASGRSTIYKPTPAETAELRQAMLKVHSDVEKRIGRDNMQAMYKAAGFNPGK